MIAVVDNKVDDPEFIPGTVHLVDLDGTLHARHADGKQKDVVLIPAPSKDPDDPLNWKPRRKLLFLFCLCLYILMVGIASAAIYSVLVPISTDSGLSVNTLVEGTGYMFLTLGWGCLICQPLAQRFGKRPVYLLSLLGTMGMMIWAPYCTENGLWIANKCLQGLFGAAIESLCEISISDVYFTHERGTYVSVYALFLAGSNFFAPVISGFINDGQGWKWVLHWCAIFNGAAFVILFFLMEETNFQREHLSSVEPGTSIDETQALDVPVIAATPTTQFDPEKNTSPQVNETGDSSEGSIMGISTKSYRQKIALIRKEDLHSNIPLKGMIFRPLIYFTFPIISFSGFMAYFSGPVGDKFVLWYARRNNGIMEPEHRLWLYCSLLVLIPGGFFLWGIGASHEVHWFGLIFAMGIFGACITIGCQLPITYCIDAYKDLSADAMVTVILIRNTMSFAVSYGITPWVTNMGYQNAFIVAAFAALAQISVFLVFIKWGKNLRKASVPRYWKYIHQLQKEGLIH